MAMHEQLVEQNKFRSFDVLASIDLLRFDQLTAGYIRHETEQRVCDEELSYVAEGINRPVRTTFELPNIDGQLSIYHKGQWQPYMDTLRRGWLTAEEEARLDPRKNFLAKWALRDLAVGRELNELQPGESLAWFNAFPEAEYQRYGGEFIDSLGLQSARRMGFIYQARKNEDGSLTLNTHSVDNSDPEAFTAAMLAASKEGASIDDGLMAYDTYMSQRDGVPYYAGRQAEVGDPEENAWTLIKQHKDLLDFYFSKLKDLATQNVSRDELTVAKKRLTYGLWASLRERLDQGVILQDSRRYYSGGFDTFNEQALLQQEFDDSYKKLVAKGEVLFGCGGMITGEEALMNAETKDVFNAVFGEKSEWKKMTCPFCGDKNQWGDPCSSNQHCKACNARVRSGRVVDKGNGGKKEKVEVDSPQPTSG